jgi:predicted CopG family antitoxin
MKKVAEKTIRIRLETHQRLIKRGTSGDTMDDVITELLDLTEKGVKK